MKKLKKLSAILVVVLVLFSAITTTAFAADVSQDGLEVSLITNKEAYEQGEQIAATLTVKNTNDFAVKNVTLESLIPDGYVLADGMSAIKEMNSLEPGETAELAVTFIAKGETPTDPTNPTDPTDPTEPTDPVEPTETDEPVDSDFTDNGVWKIIFPIMGVTGFVAIIIALAHFKKILALILAAIIGGSFITGGIIKAGAEESASGNVLVEHAITVNGQQKIIVGRVTYVNDNIELGYLHTNPTSCDVGVSADVTFYIDITSKLKIKKEDLELYFEDELIGNLNDDGKNGDEVANDGVYSGTFSMFSNERKHSKYYVKYKNQISDTNTLLFAKPRTEEESKKIDEFYLDIEKIKEKYTFSREEYDNHDEKALLKAEQCYKEIEKYLDSRSDVYHYEFTGFNIMVMFDFQIPVGIPFDDLIIEENKDTIMQLQPMSNVYSTNSDSNALSSYKSKIITLQPYYNDLQTDTFDNAATQIARENKNYVFSKNLDNDQVTIETMKSLSKYGVIIIDSHGGNWSGYGYILSLSDAVTDMKNEKYADDIDLERVIPNGGHYVITEKFFEDYYSANILDNSIIYLGTCYGGDDNVRIQQIFRFKGAEAIMAYKNTVTSKYNRNMLTTISENLAKGKTVDEAVKAAKKKHGEHDPYISSETYDQLGFWDKLWYKLGFIESANPAELILTGNNTYFALSTNPNTELITGQVVDSATGNPISKVRVTCPELDVKCFTDKNGIFKFTVSLPLRQATISFSHDDYKNKKVTVAANSYSMLDTISLEHINDGTQENPEIPSTATEFNGHYYQVYDEGMTWTEAKAYCESLGGHLVTITSEEEQKFVNSMLGKATKNSYWLGAEVVDNKFAWVTGEDFSYTNWAYMQPDHPNYEHALMAYRNKNPNISSKLGEWNDLSHNGTFENQSFFGLNNFGFICEWDKANTEKTCLTSTKCNEFTRYTGNVGDSNFTALDKSYTLHPTGTYYGYTNTGVDGKQYNNGFCVWIARWNFGDKISWAQAKFDLAGKYKTLQGSSALLKSYNTSKFNTTVYFYDGDKLLHSFTMTPENCNFDFSVNVTGVDELTVLVKDNMETAGGTSFALYDMFLT